MDLYYDRRIASAEARLEDLQMQQRATIEKLKAATKFSTTQSLIEKYGGSSTGISEPKVENKKPSSATPGTAVAKPTGPQGPPHLPQPHLPQLAATLSPDQIRVQQQLLAQQKAGIPPQFGQAQPQAQQLPRGPQPPLQSRSPQPLQMQGQTQPPSQQHLQPEEATAPKWYDRILDVVLGEDEMSAKSRFALICKNCRMVNGLAPPGTRSLDEMEEWGCARCGTMNGLRKQQRAEVKLEEKESLLELGPADVEREPKQRASSATRNIKTEDSASEEDEEVSEPESDKEELQAPKAKSKSKERRRKV
jgi:hypothetical protein